MVPVWITDRLGEGYRVFSEAGLVPARSLTNAVDAIRRWMWWGRSTADADPRWEPAVSAVGPLPPPAPSVPGAAIRVLDECTAKRELVAAGIAVPEGTLCRSPAEAADAVARYGGAVALKIVSAEITHKTDIGGVRLAVSTPEGAAAAFEEIVGAVDRGAPAAEWLGVLVERMVEGKGYEAIVGVHRDETFGHILTFGAGGVLVEVIDDHQRRMLPLTPRRAEQLIASSRLSALLSGHRGEQAVHTEALATALVSISEYVTGRRECIDQLEINPLWIAADGDRVVALDALVVQREQEGV